MKHHVIYRLLWLSAVAALVIALGWLDRHRGGPATMLSRCNLLLSRSEAPAADILIVGSSRTGAALDPIAMQQMLAHALPSAAPTVERIALGESPLRASLALLENYLVHRGTPQVIALEVMFMTERSVNRLAQRGIAGPPEQYVFRRDINLMTFEQILRLPSVAMPFSEDEGSVNRWRFRLRGIVLRAGALAYQFLRQPADSWQLAACDQAAFTREPTWPADFAFSYGDSAVDAAPSKMIETLEIIMSERAADRTLKDWQAGVPKFRSYPYDFEAAYRAGEVEILKSMLNMAARRGVPVVLLPLPLYGYTPAARDLRTLTDWIPEQTHIFDLYGQVRADLDKFWYDDGHIEVYPAGALTTAILAQHLLDTGVLTVDGTERAHD